MKQLLATALFCGATACVTTNVRPMIFPLATAGRRVAVFNLADLRDANAPEPLASPSARLRTGLNAGLARRGYTVIEPAHLDELVAAQVKSTTGAPTDDEAITVGHLCDAQVALVGSLLVYERPFWPKARVNLVLRVIDIARGTSDRTLEVAVEKSNYLYPPNLHEDVIDLAIEQILEAIRMGG